MRRDVAAFDVGSHPLGLAFAALAPIALLTLAFPEGGAQPFVASAFYPEIVGVLAILALIEPERRLLRIGVALYALALAGCYLVPSAVGGIVAVPVIAVPTSVGYGASFNGLAALLGMLNSCASNVTVVNIDNGFGAACIATLINRL